MAFKTKLRFGRALTPEEYVVRDAALVEAVANGKYNNIVVYEHDNGIALNTTIREWTTMEDAVAWVAFMNTFTPPPASAEAVNE